MAERYTFTVRFEIASAGREAFAEALAAIFAVVRAKPDLLYYHWLEDENDPTVVLVHEAWADRERFEAEEAKESYRDAFAAAIEPHVVEREMSVWKVVDAYRA